MEANFDKRNHHFLNEKTIISSKYERNRGEKKKKERKEKKDRENERLASIELG